MSELKPFMRLVKEFRDDARMMNLFNPEARKIFIVCANRLEAEIQTYNARPAPDVDALAREYAEKFKFQHMKDCFPFGVIDLEKLAKTLKQFAAELMGE